MSNKVRLTKTEQQDYNANANRLAAVGVVPREEKPLREAQMLRIERTGSSVDSFVHAPPTGGYGIVVWVRIIALKTGINLSDCEIKPRKWHDAAIELMQAPNSLGYYKAVGGVEYSKDDVLNHWISSTRSLGRGQVLEGVVVARSFSSLPSWCVDGIWIEADLCFYDQFENPYPLKVDLRVVRDEKRTERPRGDAGLYGRPAASERMHGTYDEKPDLGGRASIAEGAKRAARKRRDT